MKGYELIKAITENKIKDNTKIKVTDGILETEIKYKDGMLKWKPEQFNTAFLCDESMNFEVIEERKKIEELDEMQIINARPEINAMKINELVRAVNKLNKEREEK